MIYNNYQTIILNDISQKEAGRCNMATSGSEYGNKSFTLLRV
jgi:hypothetical protein